MRRLNWAPGDGRLKAIWLMIFVVALGAFAIRAPRLRMRPMHTDEAVHAEKFHALLEDGAYEYNPHEYHGPTLNYFTLLPTWLSGRHQYAQITEVTLRIVPVVFGVLLILLTALLADGLGWAAVFAAVLTALSPAMVFYSRYYIQEMLLVCFTFGAIVCGYRYSRTKFWPWALSTGVFIGLMHATKETAIIALGAMAATLAILRLGRRLVWVTASRLVCSDAVRRYSCMPLRAHYKQAELDDATREDRTSDSCRGHLARDARAGRPRHEQHAWHFALGLGAAILVSALFYSAFFAHPRGVLDSYLTYATYLGRAGGGNTAHVQPWYYYLRMLLFSRYEHGPVWTEGGVILLALVGLASAVRGSRFAGLDPKLVRFLAVYTVLMTVIYSVIPYKTPWCLLSFLHGMILLAGVGAVTLLAWARKPALRAAVVYLLVVTVGHLAFQTYRANFVYYADSRNPYVYAHPTTEIFTAVEKVREYAGLNGLGRSAEMPIQVMVPGGDYWPLPWYLRDLRVGYYSGVPDAAEIGPLVLLSDTLEGALIQKLYDEVPAENRRMYMYLFDEPYYIWFRPQMKLMGFVRRDLWEQHNSAPVQP